MQRCSDTRKASSASRVALGILLRVPQLSPRFCCLFRTPQRQCGLQGSSFLILICFLLKGYIILPKQGTIFKPLGSLMGRGKGSQLSSGCLGFGLTWTSKIHNLMDPLQLRSILLDIGPLFWALLEVQGYVCKTRGSGWVIRHPPATYLMVTAPWTGGPEPKPREVHTWSPKVCRILAFWAIFVRFGLFLHTLGVQLLLLQVSCLCQKERQSA